MKGIRLLICFLLVASSMASQHLRVFDTTKVKSYSDKIIIALNLDTKTNAYTVKSDNIQDFNLKTNNQVRLDISLDYEWIGFSLGYSPKFLPSNNDDDLKGESTNQEFSFRFFVQNWTQELHYRKLESFYVDNTADFIPSWRDGTDPYIQIPDFKTSFWGGITAYVLNPNFSYRNVVYNTEAQLKSAGSLIPTLAYDYSKLSYTIEDIATRENSFDIQFAPAYYYTVVIRRNWFGSLFLSPAIGVRFSTVRKSDTDVKDDRVHWPVSADGGLKIGFNSNKIIFGGSLTFESSFYNRTEVTAVTNNSVFAKIYFGYRFNSPQLIKKTFKWVNSTLGF